jgi:predicted transcriptional regulator
MVRPKAKELTDRELEVMHAFWDGGEGTAEQIRERLAQAGTKLAYATVANVVRQLEEKGFLKRQNTQRPFVYLAKRSFEDVSSRLVGHLVKKVFDGSRQELLVQVLGRKKLSKSEREYLQQLLDAQEDTK